MAAQLKSFKFIGDGPPPPPPPPPPGPQQVAPQGPRWPPADRSQRPRASAPLPRRHPPLPPPSPLVGAGGPSEQQWPARAGFEIRWHNVSLFRPSKEASGGGGGVGFGPGLLRGLWSRAWLSARPGSHSSSASSSPGPNSPNTAARYPTSSLANYSLKSASAANPNRAGQLPVLDNISGSVFSGQLTAVLGPSGVGKTTLLNSLTGRNTLEGSGRVALLGANLGKRMSVVTVPQADVLPAKLSALEDLEFTSRLKNPKKGFDHSANVDKIVRHLGMHKFLHTRVDKLSGGEARRLSIGRELLGSPDIMILDEPTSGLDANTCKKIITALRDICEHSDRILGRPMSIIVTIHQPQREVLQLFHRLYVLALGGRAIYEGPPTHLMSTLLEHSSLTKLVEQPSQLNENPAIVALELASGEYGETPIDELALYHENELYDQFYNSALYDEFAGPQSAGPGTPVSTPGLPLRRSGRKSPLLASTPLFAKATAAAAAQARAQAEAQAAAAAAAAAAATAGTPPSSNNNGAPNSSQPASLNPAAAKFRPRLNSSSSSLGGRLTPIIGKRLTVGARLEQRFQSLATISYASTYDLHLPEPTTKLKVDKRLRRSVVLKGDFLSQTRTLMSRCWLLTTRDLFLMSIRILGFFLVASGMVQIFSGALDPNENQCPVYVSEVDDIPAFMLSTRNRLLNLQHTAQQASSTHLFFFQLMLSLVMVTSALTGLMFPFQARMFAREHKNGWYTPTAFIVSQTLAELPVDIIGPTLTVLIVYPLCGQPASAYYWRELGYVVSLSLACIVCKSQAQIAGAILMDSVQNSVFVSCVLVTVPALLSGISVKISNLSRPLQVLSYGSFLRYAFESLFVIRYGYDICPCDQELVFGYPSQASSDAIPAQLDNMARIIFSSGASSPVSASNATAADLESGLALNSTSSDTNATAITNQLIQQPSNLFNELIRLVTSSSNMFVPNIEQLGDCKHYRSLYLMDMGVPDKILGRWFMVLVFMFVVSRIITYYVVKTVINIRRH